MKGLIIRHLLTFFKIKQTLSKDCLRVYKTKKIFLKAATELVLELLLFLTAAVGVLMFSN